MPTTVSVVTNADGSKSISIGGFLAPEMPAPPPKVEAGAAAAAAGGRVPILIPLIAGGYLGQWLYDNYPPEVLFPPQVSGGSSVGGSNVCTRPGYTWAGTWWSNHGAGCNSTIVLASPQGCTGTSYCSDANPRRVNSGPSGRYITLFNLRPSLTHLDKVEQWDLGESAPMGTQLFQDSTVVLTQPDPYAQPKLDHPLAPQLDVNVLRSPPFYIPAETLPTPRERSQKINGREVPSTSDGRTAIRYRYDTGGGKDITIVEAPPAEPPPRNTKEKKTRGRGLTLANFMDLLSESSEVIDAVYQALPEDVRKRWERDRDLDRPGDQFGQYGISGADWKLQAIWYNWHRIDAASAVANIIRNEIEDRLYGRSYAARDRLRPNKRFGP